MDLRHTFNEDMDLHNVKVQPLPPIYAVFVNPSEASLTNTHYEMLVVVNVANDVTTSH